MLRVQVPNGWYADMAGVTGDYAVLIPDSHIQTSRGDVALPGESVLYIRCQVTAQNVLELCGVGHSTDIAWLWNGTRWINNGLAVGVSACIFDQDGRLHVNDGSAGSQGFRYVAENGRIFSGDDTYNATTLLAQSYGLKSIFEWTHLGGLTIGQADEEKGCLTIGPNGRRILEPGNCRFVRFVRSGAACAVALWKPLERCAVLLWFKADELAMMPVQDETPPDPDPDPDPEEPVIVNLPHDVFVTIKAFYDKFGLPEGDDAQRAHQGRCCETVRARHGDKWGWKRADAGRPPSADAVAYMDGAKMWVWDCVQDAGGPGRRFSLQDGAEGEDVSNQIFIQVSPIDHLGNVPDPGDISPAVKAYVDDWGKRLETRLTEQLTALSEAVAVMVNEDLPKSVREEVKKAIDALPTPGLPADVVRMSTHKGRVSIPFVGGRDVELVKK